MFKPQVEQHLPMFSCDTITTGPYFQFMTQSGLIRIYKVLHYSELKVEIKVYLISEINFKFFFQLI